MALFCRLRPWRGAHWRIGSVLKIWSSRSRASSRHSRQRSAGRRIMSTATSTSMCFRKFASAVLRALKDAAPRAWLRQCGRAGAARKSLADPKGFVLDALSARLRGSSRSPWRAHQSGICRHLFLCAGRRLRQAVPDLSRRPAGRWAGDVPSGQSRQRTAAISIPSPICASGNTITSSARIFRGCWRSVN